MAVREGDGLMLEREPDNPVDACAILVVHNEQPVGYIQRQKAAVLAPLIDAGWVYTAVCLTPGTPVQTGRFRLAAETMTVRCDPVRPLRLGRSRVRSREIEDA